VASSGGPQSNTQFDFLDARTLIVRASFLLAFVAALVLLPAATEDHGLRAIIPLYVINVFILLFPTLWPREVDLCAPVVLPWIMAAFVAVSTMLSFYEAGEIRIDLVSMLTPDHAEALASRTLYALAIGQLSYLIGYYSSLGPAIRGWFPTVGGLVWDRRRLSLVSAVTLAFFVAAYVVFQARTGVPLFDFTQYGAGKSAWRDDPTLSWMLRGVMLGMVPVFLYLTRAMAERRLRGFIPALAVTLGISLLISRLGQRGPVAYAILALVFVFHYLWRRVPVILFAGVYFVGLAVSNITYEWRVAPQDTPREMALMRVASDPGQVLIGHENERQRFASLAVVMDAIPDRQPYLLGESWISMAYVLVPRWVWPEKGDSSKWQDTRIVHTLSGAPIPTPFVGILYANLSWIGIIAGMFLFGAFHRGLYEWLRLNIRDPSVVLLYALILNNFGPTLLGISAALSYVLPVYLVIKFAGRRAVPT